MSVEYFKTHNHKLELTLTVDGIDMSHVILATLQRGSAGGFFVEELSGALLENHLAHVPAKGYDFIARRNSRQVECKGFGKNGTDLSPSDMKGKGRSFNQERFNNESRTKDFIVGDMTNLGESFSYVVLPGHFVVGELGHRVTTKNRAKVFDSGKIPTGVDW